MEGEFSPAIILCQNAYWKMLMAENGRHPFSLVQDRQARILRTAPLKSVRVRMLYRLCHIRCDTFIKENTLSLYSMYVCFC